MPLGQACLLSCMRACMHLCTGERILAHVIGKGYGHTCLRRCG